MRDLGYYWIKINGDWHVAFYCEIIGMNRFVLSAAMDVAIYNENECEEINEERILAPDEK